MIKALYKSFLRNEYIRYEYCQNVFYEECATCGDPLSCRVWIYIDQPDFFYQREYRVCEACHTAFQWGGALYGDSLA